MIFAKILEPQGKAKDPVLKVLIGIEQVALETIVESDPSQLVNSIA
jgi:hypothetical protein